MSEDFEDYIKVKNLKVSGEEQHLIRIKTDSHTFAHIVLTPAVEGAWNLSVYQVSEDDKRTLVKWVPGLECGGDC